MVEGAFVATSPAVGFRFRQRNTKHNESSDDDHGADNSTFLSATTSRRRGTLFRITGESTPYKFPVRPLQLQKEWTDSKSPFTDADTSRLDSSDDRLFYLLPRIVYHIDEPAVCALTQHYRRTISKGSDVLDLCSSWVSHFPVEFPDEMSSIAGVGMNAIELSLNDQLNSWKVLDLNSPYAKGRPVAGLLPYDDDSFDAVTCACSFDYLISPIEVIREVRRILRPGGAFIVAFSNRCFGTKATRLWRINGNRVHAELLNGYFHYAGGFRPREVYDITADISNEKESDGICNRLRSLLPMLDRQDPMFVVQARKE